MENKVIKGIANDGKIRIIACTVTELLNKIRTMHSLNELTNIVFGKFMMAGCMISAMNKTASDTVTLRIKCEGSIRNMSVVTKGDGTLKGYISNPDAFSNTYKIKDIIGDGFLTITKDFGLKNPYTGIAPLKHMDIAQDLSHYFTVSEQTPTAIGLGLDLNENCDIKSSAGLMVQMLPGSDERIIDIIEYRFQDLGDISNNLRQGKTIYDIVNFMFDDIGLKILEEKTIDYKCDCSKDKVERVFISIGIIELNNMIKDKKTEEIVCDYCKKTYKFTTEDIEKLAKKLIKKD